MRGKHCKAMFLRAFSRITPADAGKTLRTTIICSDVKDHPRGCGENAFGLSQALSLSGSPPRMRGKRDIYTDAMALNRITPADAGKTVLHRSRCLQHRDHPRGCGENRMSRECRLSDLGSPPRMRGKLFRHSLFLFRGRITPADAGKTI